MRRSAVELVSQVAAGRESKSDCSSGEQNGRASRRAYSSGLWDLEVDVIKKLGKGFAREEVKPHI